MEKKQYTFYSFLGVIGDIIFYPVVFISLLSSVIMFYSKRQNIVPSIFGVSLVQILSPSMVKTEFYPGQSVFVQSVTPQNLKIGDVIAFYFFSDPADSSVKIQPLTQTFVSNPNFNVSSRATISKARESKTKVYFHQVINIFVDEGGTRFFETKGSSNASPDEIKVREDFVVGKYLNTPKWMRDLMTFCSSSLGMIFLVVFPLSLVVLIQSLSIIDQFNNLYLEKKLLAGLIDWRADEIKKGNIGRDMQWQLKVYFFASAQAVERDKVFEFLWKDLKNGDGKQKREYEVAKMAKKMLSSDEKSYWSLWRTQAKNKKDFKTFEKYEKLRFEKKQ
ncbi:MAG: hypothetical protein RR140_00425 [Clostridia bacterium]